MFNFWLIKLFEFALQLYLQWRWICCVPLGGFISTNFNLGFFFEHIHKGYLFVHFFMHTIASVLTKSV